MTDIRQCIADEMVRFEQMFSQSLNANVVLAQEVVRYFLDRRGKQLRPIMTILSAKVVSGQVSDATLHAAVALELLHNASLMHDDVVDQSGSRRGAATVNQKWDNRVAVLMGDFFLSRCLAESNATGSLQVSEILASMVSRLAEGELEQLSNVHSHTFSESSYFSVIRGKTASLFAACLKAGALTADASATEVELMGRVGELMGLVFQIRDDVFDYFDATAELGKPTGHDIREGKVTLPLIHALEVAPHDESSRMCEVLAQDGELTDQQVASLVAFAKQWGGIDYAEQYMQRLVGQAKALLSGFADSPAAQSLESLVDYCLERKF